MNILHLGNSNKAMYFSEMENKKTAMGFLDKTYKSPLIEISLANTPELVQTPSKARHLLALIDTGAYYNFCSKGILDELGIRKSSNTASFLQIQTSEEKVSPIYEGCIWLHGNGILCNTQILEMPNAIYYDFIIGTNFLEEFLFIFNPKNGIVSLEHVGK